MGVRSAVARNTLANANARRNWRIYADFAQHLIVIARELYKNEPFGIDLAHTVYALDATTIDLCLSLFTWAPFRRAKGAIKLHTLLDLRGNIPTFLHISDGKVSDVTVLDKLTTEPGAFYIMDRGYTDFKRLHHAHQSGAFFVIRAKANMQFNRLSAVDVDKSTGLRCDQTIVLTGPLSSKNYPDRLRRVKVYDPEHETTIVLLTNNFLLSATTISELYRSRWQVELFFRWIKQHLRIKTFYGNSENAVRTQIWIAVSVYLLAAIVKKRLVIKASLHSMLEVLDLNVFEKITLKTLFDRIPRTQSQSQSTEQLRLL